MESASRSLLDDALEDELTTKWKGAYTGVSLKCISPDANVISSHVLYKIQDAPKGLFRLKDRLVLHGTRV